MNAYEHSFVIDYGVPNSERIARIQRGNTKIQNCELTKSIDFPSDPIG